MAAASRDGMAGRSRRPGWAAAARCAASVMGGAVGGSSALRRRARPTRSWLKRPTARSGTAGGPASARAGGDEHAACDTAQIPRDGAACPRRAAVARCRNASLRLPVCRQDSASQWWITPRSALLPWRRAIRATPARISGMFRERCRRAPGTPAGGYEPRPVGRPWRAGSTSPSPRCCTAGCRTGRRLPEGPAARPREIRRLASPVAGSWAYSSAGLEAPDRLAPLVGDRGQAGRRMTGVGPMLAKSAE